MSPDGPLKPSPEERLLRLIRGKSAAAGAVVPASARAIERGPLIVSGTSTQGPSNQWTKFATVGLLALLVAEGAYLMIEITHPVPEVAMPPVPDVSLRPPEAVTPPEVPSLSATVTRPLFASPVGGAPAASTPGPSSTAPSTMAKSLGSRLTLMGIMDGDPAQVIIEDTETKKTYFVIAGQQVVEGAVLDQVLDNRVILDLGGEKITLSL